jgi:hypothetical protein
MTFKLGTVFTTATLATLSLGILANSAQAALLVNVVGTPGSGFTLWSFSGSAIASENGTFLDANNDIGEIDSTQWKEIGDYVITALNDLIVTDPLSTASVTTTSGGTQGITGVLIDRDGSVPGTNNDDWAIIPSADLAIASGDTVSWTGSLTLNVDINNFFLGTVGSAESAPGGLTDTQLTFATPEPITLLGASAAIGFGALFKRQKGKSANK